MLEESIYVLAMLNVLVIGGAIGVGLQRWHSLTWPLRCIWVGILSYGLLFLVSLLMILFRMGISTLFIEYLIAASLSLGFGLAFARLVPTERRRGAILGLGALGLGALVVESVLQQRFMAGSLWGIPCNTVLNTLITLLFLHHLLRTTMGSLLAVPMSWMAAGYLISTLANTVFDAFRQEFLDTSRTLALQMMVLQLVMSIGCNGLYAVGFRKVRPAVRVG